MSTQKQTNGSGRQKHSFSALFFFTATALLFLAALRSGAQVEKGTWTTDLDVNHEAGKFYRDARISAAYDGTLYLGRLKASAPDGPYQDWEVVNSTDNGATWTAFVSSFVGGSNKYTAFDMIAAGTGADFKVFVVRSYLDTSSSDANIACSKYDSSGAQYDIILDETSYNYNPTRGWDKISLCSDWKAPAHISLPFSVTVAAVKANPYDSVVAWSTSDGGSLFMRNSIYGTPGFIRNISAAVGSNSFSTNDYPKAGIVWDERSSDVDSFGKIKGWFIFANDATNRYNHYFIIGDSTASYRNASIAMSQKGPLLGATGPGYHDIRTMIAFESFIGSDPDIKYVMSDSLFVAPDFSNVISQAATGTYEVDPCINYDPVDDNFNITYYVGGSTQSLPYYAQPLSAAYGVSFSSVKANYRNAATSMTYKDAMPRMDLTPGGKAVFVWNDEGATMFDKEVNVLGISNVASLEDFSVFPNPAHGSVHLSFKSATTEDYTITLSDLSGKTVFSQQEKATGERNEVQIYFPQLPSGLYMLTLSGNSIKASVKISVAE